MISISKAHCGHQFHQAKIDLYYHISYKLNTQKKVESIQLIPKAPYHLATILIKNKTAFKNFLFDWRKYGQEKPYRRYKIITD